MNPLIRNHHKSIIFNETILFALFRDYFKGISEKATEEKLSCQFSRPLDKEQVYIGNSNLGKWTTTIVQIILIDGIFPWSVGYDTIDSGSS